MDRVDNDMSHEARHRINEVIRNDWEDPWTGDRWRLLYGHAEYAEPWKCYSWDEVENEFPDNESLFVNYIKDLCRRYEGEVALAWESWVFSPTPLPRDKVLWHPQYATKLKGQRALVALPKGGDPRGRFDDDVDLLAVGSTTILRAMEGGDGHWHLRGGAITLPQLFAKVGSQFAVQELMFWYSHAPKVVKKRLHAWGSEDVRQAAQLRKRVFNHYGHRH